MALSLNPGRFRETVTIERIKSDAAAGLDGHIDYEDDATWGVLLTRRGEVKDITMREQMYANSTTAVGMTRITVRYDGETADIIPKDRVRVGCGAHSGLYQIDGVVRVGSPVRLIELSCKRTI